MTFPENIFAGQKFAVVGLGRAGLPSALALRAMGAEVVAWDDAALARDAAIAAGLTVAMPDMGICDELILSPGIPHLLPRPHPLAVAARDAGKPIRADADLLFRAAKMAGSRAKFAGITGTNGKSTTTALLAHILATAGRPVAAGANLGTAALALPFLDTPDAVYVLEMSSYMLERLGALRFDAAAMLNLSPDHLDRHGDMAGYMEAKRQIFARQTTSDVAVIGIDDDFSLAMAESLRDGPARVVTISGAATIARAKTLPGPHNAQNAAGAAALAAALAIAPDAIDSGLKTFPGLPHRQEHIRSVAGIDFINDSKATNADSAARALACHDRVIWIAGGMAKAGGIEPLVPFFPRLAKTFLIGRDATLLAATLDAHGARNQNVGTLEAAVAAAWSAAREGAAQVVLLSPACASWDQFSGFEQRGDAFRALVMGIAA